MSEDLRDKITAAIDRAEQVARAATPGPWEQGGVWLRAGVWTAETPRRPGAAIPVGQCAYCHLGEPAFVEPNADINGKRMTAHIHRSPDPWDPEHSISGGDGSLVLQGSSDYEPNLLAVDATHIALNDPAAVLRRCAADRRVLERHRPTRWPNIEDGYDAPTCAGCGRDDHGEPRYLVPCPEITDCADRWGVDA